MYVSMYVCMLYVCVYVCMYVCMYGLARLQHDCNLGSDLVSDVEFNLVELYSCCRKQGIYLF